MFKDTPFARQNKVLTGLWNHLFLPHTSLCHLTAFTDLLENSSSCCCSMQHGDTLPGDSAGTVTKQLLTTTLVALKFQLFCSASYSIAHSMAPVQVPCCMEGQHGQ